jgi:hypothetical protein
VSLPIKTISEKCVWAPSNAPQSGAPGGHSVAQNVIAGKELVAYCAVPVSPVSGTYLRDWYRGAVHSEDSWWKVDVSAGTVERIFSPDANLSLDVENPSIDGNGSYIAFMNAADKSLWMLRITP